MEGKHLSLGQHYSGFPKLHLGPIILLRGIIGTCTNIYFMCHNIPISLFSNRALHIPFLYKHIHKKHHEWTAPIGITAMYNHPLEHLTSNALTVSLLEKTLAAIGAMHISHVWTNFFAVAIQKTCMVNMDAVDDSLNFFKH